jgi:phosphatidylinositol alpha-mannosyltransferase
MTERKALRVAIFHATLPELGRKLGGVEVTVHRLANALVEYCGCDVTLFSCSQQADDVLYYCSRISSKSVANYKLLRLIYLPIKLNFIDFSTFDVLHLHGDDWFFFKRRLPTIRTLHGSALHEARFAQNWRRKLLQYGVYPLEHISARLATLSLAVGTEAVAIYDAAGLANNGVDLNIFKPRVKSLDPLLFYIGTWRGRKRGEFAYRMFVERILPRWPTARLFMACDYVPEHPSVVDGGFPIQEVLADWMARAWVFLYPSLYEGFGIPYAEALASGTVIVTSPNSGADYVLEHGRYGVMCGDDDIQAAVSALLADSAARKDLEQRGLQRAEHFSWRNVSQEHVQAYELAIRNFRA